MISCRFCLLFLTDPDPIFWPPSLGDILQFLFTIFNWPWPYFLTPSLGDILQFLLTIGNWPWPYFLTPLSRWHPALSNRSGGDWHCLWDPLRADEGPGARGTRADHPSRLQCPPKRNADQDLWTHTPGIQKGEIIIDTPQSSERWDNYRHTPRVQEGEMIIDIPPEFRKVRWL